MPKMITPAMQKKKYARTNAAHPSLWLDAWKRLQRNKAALFGLFIILLLAVAALIPGLIAPYGYDDQNYADKFRFPSWTHLMGTDNLGRDILSRIIYAARISILVGLVSVGLSCVAGGLLGALAAFYGGKLDNIIMRAVDILMAVPSILLAISIAAALGSGLFNLMLAIAISDIPMYARVVRAAILTVKEQEYIEAARSVGGSTSRLIFRHMIPNAMAPIIVQATLGVAGAILSAAGLSFIGLGVQPPTPEWGAMLAAGRQYIRDYWFIVTFPGLTIMLTIFALNLFGDGLRDALDPRLKN